MSVTRVIMDFPAPSKELCEKTHKDIAEYLMKDFETNLRTHHSKGHKYFIQGTVHSICKDLFLDKQLVIYILLGSNSLRKSWGNLKETFDLEPVKYVLRRAVREEGKKVFADHGYKAYFGDQKHKGDFHMKVDFYKYTEAPSTDSEGFQPVESKKTKKPVLARTYAKVATSPAQPVVAKPTPAPKTKNSEMEEVLKKLADMEKLLKNAGINTDVKPE